jgi:O-antigen/teichoic acid export membrane protein
MLGSIVRNFSAFGAAHVVDRVVTFLFLVYAARALGPDVFGQYVLIGAYVTFFSVSFTAGVMPVALREIVRHRDNPRPMLEQMLSLRLVLGLAAYATLVVICGVMLPAETYLPLAALAGSALVIEAFKDSFATYHTAMQRMTIPSAFQAASAILTSVTGAILLHLGYGLIALLSAFAIINLAVTVSWHFMFTARFQRYRIYLGISAWRELLVLAAPIAPLVFVFQFNRLVSVMLLPLIRGPIPGERAAGYFGTAQQIAGIPLGFLVGLRRAMMPPIAAKISGGERIDEEFAVSLRVAVVFLSFPMLVLTSAFPAEILGLAFGPEYSESALPLKLLGAAAALTIAASFPETFVISYAERQITRYLPAAITTLLVNVGLCVALIPDWGAAGAASAFLASRAVHLAFFLYYSRAVLPLDGLGLARMAVPVMVLCAAYAAALYATEAIESTALRLLTVGAVCAAGMLAAGRRELAWLRGLMLRRGRQPPRGRP